LPGVWYGGGAATLALALIALPIPLTRYWSHSAVSEDPEQRASAIQWLRRLGHEETLLADCYGSTRVSREGPFGWSILGEPVNLEDARAIYYRVTGLPFNAVPPPQLRFATRAWNFLDDVSWDPEQAGTVVGGRAKGLSLAQSRLDALTNPDEAWSYVEWTLEFRNVSPTVREARAQIALPPGGVVSRLTLWVNGEEREAAFAGSSQVREAYEQVVKVQRRDPVLVTTCGPDRVFMQCYPVPRDGGTIKVRLGITAPLALPSADEAVVRWPFFIERNFSVPKGVEHSVWIESRQPLRSASVRLKPDTGKPGINGLHGQLTELDLGDPRSAVRARRAANAMEAWVGDPQDGGQVIRQFVASQPTRPPARVVFVVDGTRNMTEFYSQIAQALSRLPEGIEFSVLLAHDGVTEVSGPWSKADATRCRGVAAHVARIRGTGGQDNVPALLRAWDLAAESPTSVIVWIHGPQPVLLGDLEALKQRFEWRPGAGVSTNAPLLYDLQTQPGPDRVLEKLNGVAAVRPVPRSGTVAEDLEALLEGWRGAGRTFVLSRDRVTLAPAALAQRGTEGSKHIARLWAFEEVKRLLAARQTEAAIELAGRYQLVTPVSGAVVLETREQFQRAGLQPVDATTVPVVPEPGVLALFGLGVAACLLRRCWPGRTRG
jgi:hypothetical protein